MKTHHLRTASAIGLTLAASIVLTGCTINIGTDGRGNSMMDSGMMSDTFSNSEYSQQDVMFAQMMIPHHQQAVDMSQLAQTRSTNPELLALAKQIENAQAPEIEQMQGWIEASGSSMHMNHEMGMGGMLSDEDMADLEKASGNEFDRLYLTGMIAHHEGAIAMTHMITNSDNSEVKQLSENIVNSQTAEIEQMKKMLEALA